MKKYKIFFKKPGKRITNSRTQVGFTPEEAYNLWCQYWRNEGDKFISMHVWDDVKGLVPTNWFPPALPAIVPETGHTQVSPTQR